MASSSEDLTSSLALETRRLRAEFTELNRVSASFGRTVTSAFAGAISGGRKLSDVLRSLMASLSRQTLSAALRPLGNAIGGQLANLLSPGKIVPFAAGGSVLSFQKHHPHLVNDGILGPATRAQIDRDVAARREGKGVGGACGLGAILAAWLAQTGHAAGLLVLAGIAGLALLFVLRRREELSHWIKHRVG